MLELPKITLSDVSYKLLRIDMFTGINWLLYCHIDPLRFEDTILVCWHCYKFVIWVLFNLNSGIGQQPWNIKSKFAMDKHLKSVNLAMYSYNTFLNMKIFARNDKLYNVGWFLATLLIYHFKK